MKSPYSSLSPPPLLYYASLPWAYLLFPYFQYFFGSTMATAPAAPAFIKARQGRVVTQIITRATTTVTALVTFGDLTNLTATGIATTALPPSPPPPLPAPAVITRVAPLLNSGLSLE